MDTSRDILYRGVLLNDEDILDSLTGGGATGTGLSGSKLDSFDLSDVDIIQWNEKRSQADGNDAGDVFQGMRRIRIGGTLYATTRALLFDALFELRAALNPVLAQREEPLDYGYRPLYFGVPTNRQDDYPSGAIDLMVYAMPRAFQQITNDEQIGEDDEDALAVSWQATMLCRDPGIYGVDAVDVSFDDDLLAEVHGATISAATNLVTSTAHGLVAGDRVTFFSLTGGTGLSTGTTYYVIAGGLTANAFAVSTTSGGSAVDVTVNYTDADYAKSFTVAGNWTNRGTYLGIFNAVILVGEGAGTISATVGDSVFTVTVPASTGARTIRIKGTDKMLTFEEDDVETPQMSRIAFVGDTSYPRVDPGETPYSITFHGMAGVGAGSHMWFYEQYA